MRIRQKAQLVKWEGKHAVLELDSGEQVKLLKDQFSSWSEPGDSFVLTILPEAEAALEQEALARTLLNQILDHAPENQTKN